MRHCRLWQKHDSVSAATARLDPLSSKTVFAPAASEGKVGSDQSCYRDFPRPIWLGWSHELRSPLFSNGLGALAAAIGRFAALNAAAA